MWKTVSTRPRAGRRAAELDAAIEADNDEILAPREAIADPDADPDLEVAGMDEVEEIEFEA